MTNTLRRAFSIRRSAWVIAIGLIAAAAVPSLRLRAADLPKSITDDEFWTLTEQLSEPNGFFRSDNFLSNEMGYQYVIPSLEELYKPNVVYMGVGPEQNFPYIDAIRPGMAFIIDIRRGNLHEHLLYKALFEMSADRAEFLSKLFSRERPAGLSKESSVEQLFGAYGRVQTTEERYKANLKDVMDWLTTKKHHFKLSADDVDGIAYVYHDAFYVNGPNLNYSAGRGGGGNMATYQDLMLASDGRGLNHGFLATEENYAFIKDLETKNLIVPVVGNFGGPKAIRAVGAYVKEHGGTVVAFYLSNVEQFLAQDRLWDNFCASVGTLPLDETSTYIYTGRGSPYGNGGGSFGGGGGFGGLNTTFLRPMRSEVNRSCPAK